MTNIIRKADECLECVRRPCQLGCPLNNDIRGFIKLVKEEKYREAYQLLSETTVIPSICGRVCPKSKQCEGKCVKGRIKDSNAVEIGKIEAFIGDMALKNNWAISSLPLKNKCVAVVGGGPSGLTCAAFLRRNGYNVTIYERHDYLGGLLYHGIPEFRLDKTLLEKVIDKILELGIDVKLDQSIGKDFSLEDLETEYDAVFLGFGANLSSKMNIPGEDLDGVYGGNELLESNNYPDYEGKVVVVSGCGNVAMDVARTIKRKGASRVYVIYRRSEVEAPAEEKEIKEARNEGVEFLFQNNIIGIYGEKSVEKVEVIKTELVKKDDDDRLSPVNIEGTNYYLSCDYVIMAIGSHPESSVVNSLGLEFDKRERILIDKDGHTSKEKVFAGGDLAGTTSTVAFASRAGRDAAYAIIKYLENSV
ncbi:MAG TPA: FAD-dependent oxidoreductase [Candidatus Onthousia excrementipullorum]|uniref:FAD-dependent oxidoreductase n=1 Tax=Candidatus Onthousia excrementipullorum TaxID=2840884 RepID=A0A9D1DUP0_9FIRM|nr:FAD-dependent oxidoreductase [Candidatus Onthousia excrementipullorum]